VSFRGAFIDEKRRLEARITQLEEELEEEQTNTELTGDKQKKLAMTVEQLMLDLAAEKANNQKAEVNKYPKKRIQQKFILFK
jgi:myosin protein heavy chain